VQTAGHLRPLTALRNGFTGATRSLWQFVATILVAAILAAAALLIADMLAERSAWLAALAGLAAALLVTTLALGGVRLSLRLHDGYGAGLAVLVACAGKAPGALAAGAAALAGVAFVVLPAVSLTVTFSLLAVMSPLWTPLAASAGILAALLAAWAGGRYLFLAHVIADQDAGPLDALRRCAALTRGRRAGAAVFVALVSLLNLLGLCAAGAGLLFTLPVSIAALTHAYRRLVPAPDARTGTPAGTLPGELSLEPARAG